MDKKEFYRKQHGYRDDGQPIDWPLWIANSGVAQTFQPGARYAAVADLLGSCANKPRILEIGCGSGLACAYMLQHAATVTGVDIDSPPHLKNNREPRLNFVEYDADGIWPFPDQSFDLVVAMMVVEHVFDPFHFVDEARRVLVRGGSFIINVPIITYFKHRLKFLLGQVPTTSSAGWFEERSWDGGHIHNFNVPLVDRLLTEAGFRVRRRVAVGQAARLKSLFPNLLAAELTFVADAV